MKLWLLFYRVLTHALLPIIIVYLIIRVYQKKEKHNNLLQRFGFTDKKSKSFNFKSKIIWIHGVSIGEANSAFLIAEELLKFSPQYKILLTTTTLTSANIINQKLVDYDNKIIHQFLPIDIEFCVNKFLNFWKPHAIIFLESEIWPNFIAIAKSKKIPLFLVNARISFKALNKWIKLKKLGFNIFDYFSTIFAQSSEEQNKIQQIYTKPVYFYGNLKSQTKILKVDWQELENLKIQINNRPIWLCASTHKGEEEIILKVHKKLREQFNNLLTIIILRHPQRLNEVKSLIDEQANIAIRSKNQNISIKTEIYLVDTLNELGIFYSLADFAFIGGSLLPIGGHNPFEAIKLNCAVISGLGVANFAEIYNELLKNEAVIMIKNYEELYNEVKQFIIDENRANKYRYKSLEILDKNSYCVDNIIKKINEIITN